MDGDDNLQYVLCVDVSMYGDKIDWNIWARMEQSDFLQDHHLK